MTERRSKPEEYARYTRYSDAELLSFLKEGEENFVPAAWQDLNREIASRQLAVEQEPQEANVPDDPAPPKPAPVGIGGWLLLFQVYVVTQALVTLYAAVMLLRYENVWLPVTVGATILATFIVGMLLIYAREPSARSYWIGTMAVAAGMSLVSGISGRIRFVPALISTVWAYAWAMYWLKSERVRATFQRVAAD